MRRRHPRLGYIPISPRLLTCYREAGQRGHTCQFSELVDQQVGAGCAAGSGPLDAGSAGSAAGAAADLVGGLTVYSNLGLVCRQNCIDSHKRQIRPRVTRIHAPRQVTTALATMILFMLKYVFYILCYRDRSLLLTLCVTREIRAASARISLRTRNQTGGSSGSEATLASSPTTPQLSPNGPSSDCFVSFTDSPTHSTRASHRGSAMP